MLSDRLGEVIYPEPKVLWSLPPHEFNEWRANNDIPRLFSFFKQLLPNFGEWLESLPFGEDISVRIVPTGSIFKGDRKTVIRRKDDGRDSYVIECFDGTAEEARSWWGVRFKDIEILGEIKPYFKWARETLGRNRFFCYDKLNKQFADTFLYGSWSGAHPDCNTSAILFRELRVLKLGQIALPRMTIIGSRNLDFADLDYITVTDSFHGSWWTTISFSSCRGIRIIDAELAFFTFFQCPIDSMTIENSRIQDFYFEKIPYFTLNLNRSFISQMGFKESSLLPQIEFCELREVNFQPDNAASPSQIAATYRLFRSAFQASGMRREAAECYYKERVFERKSDFHPYIEHRKIFPVPYGGCLSQVLSLYNKGFFDKRTAWKQALIALRGQAKLHFWPKYAIPLAGFRIKWLASLLESVIWGYGERPSRIFLSAISLIFAYSAIYHNSAWPDSDGNAQVLGWMDSLYLSLVTFSTLGYGDITPKTSALKLLCGSEAVLGGCALGLIVAGFSNRNRY